MDTEDQKRDVQTTIVKCTTSVSPEPFTLEIHHAWSPLGAERFVELVNDGFFTDVALFRCVEKFLVQFGISPDASSEMKKYWKQRGAIKDDPPLDIPFKRGVLSFAGGGKDSRTTQLFITFNDLKFLGKPEAPWETPLGVVTVGMETVVDAFYNGYGDQKPFNRAGVDQSLILKHGNEYLRENFPNLSYFKECQVVEEIPYENFDFILAEVKASEGGGNDLWVPPTRPAPQEIGGDIEDDSHGRFDLILAEVKASKGGGNDLWVPPTRPAPQEIGGDIEGDSHGRDNLYLVGLLPFAVLGMVFFAWTRTKKPKRPIN